VNKQSNITKKTALYCRTALYDDLAIQKQKNELIAYAEKQGYKNITVYSDNGFSGIKFNRPAFKKLNADITKGKVERIITLSISRIGRDRIKTPQWIDWAIEENIDVIILNNPEGIKSPESPEFELLLKLLAERADCRGDEE